MIYVLAWVAVLLALMRAFATKGPHPEGGETDDQYFDRQW